MKLSHKLVGLTTLFLIITCSFFLLRPSARHAPAPAALAETGAKVLSPAERQAVAESFGRIPLHFELNRGQSGHDVRFISRGGNHGLLLTPEEARLVLPNHQKARGSRPEMAAPDVLKMKLVDANANPSMEGVDELPGRANYYLGDDKARWQEGVETYRKVKYSDVYAGVDMVYYGNQRQLEYDFVVAPGASPDVIRLRFENVKSVRLDEQGDLLLGSGKHLVRQQSPVVYQETDGARQEVASSYVLHRDGANGAPEVGFRLGEYDRSKPLVIDPVIVFSTYLGGSAGDDIFNIESGFGIAVDGGGNIYVAGVTPSSDFPTLNPQQAASGGNYDAFITKLNPTGTALLYSTYFGGSDEDRAFSISLGPSNEIFVGGYTLSTNFPTMTPLQPNNNGIYDGFIARFTSAGALSYATYLGGSGGEACTFIKNEGADTVVFAGGTGSQDFPVANALQPFNAGQSDFFVGKLNLATNTLVFSTYFGGIATDNMNLSSGGVDPAGNIYIAGVSNSFNYPVTPGAFQTENGGSDDVVVTKLSPSGSSIIYSTFIGGNLIDSADAMAVDSNGNAYLTGFTRSANYPTRNAVQPQLKDPDAFVTKLNAAGSELVFSTFLGGLNLERGSGIAVDAAGNCYVTGRSNSGDFPSRRALRPPRGVDDAFISRFNRDGALLFSTLYGGAANDYGFGIVADSNNNAYVTGRATRNFLTTPGAFQSTVGGNADGFVVKINTSVRKVKSDFDGDGRTDVAVFRPSNGVWYILRTSSGTMTAQQFGQNGDIPVPGDYDGDGKTDLAVFRPSTGVWYILGSRTNSLRSVFWGVGSDRAVPGDYDGDDKTDIAIYRPSSGMWMIILSSNNSLRTVTFGQSGDVPVPADFDGDSVTDIAVFRPSDGLWSVVGSFAGIITQQHGVATDELAAADYDGDGYDDLALYRPSEGTWYILRSDAGNALFSIKWGLDGDIPSAGDYDGDGKEDVAVFRPSNGTWYVRLSSNGSIYAQPFGAVGDIPIAGAYQPQ